MSICKMRRTGSLHPLSIFQVNLIPEQPNTPSSETESQVTSSHSLKIEGNTPRARNIYTDLDNVSESMRILILEAGALDDLVICSLENAQLDQHPQFEALSYVWGDQADRKDIIVNAERIDVTENLEAALRHLRTESVPRRVRINDICVNQKNNEEKSQQVGMMTRIYPSESEVVIWLGPTEENSDSAIELMDRMMVAVKETDRGYAHSLNPQLCSMMIELLIEE